MKTTMTYNITIESERLMFGHRSSGFSLNRQATIMRIRWSSCHDTFT